METKPFNLQSPEQIAKDYGGNKQKIAEAMQTGVVDPTAGVLAGMFIDRMRAAQMQEQAPQQSVAEQTFPQIGQMPQQAMPQQQMLAAPQGGVEAEDVGIGALPVPDHMFDEGAAEYAGGGLVAFADGGPVGPWFENTARQNIPGIIITSRQRTAAQNRAAGGVPNSHHLANNARDFVPPRGMPMAAMYARLRQLFPGADVLNEGDHVHVEPGEKQGWWGSAPSEGDVGISSVGAYEEPPNPLADYLDPQKGLAALRGMLPEDTPQRDKFIAEQDRILSDEYQDKRRKDDLWMTLAQLGFGMAASDSPYLLQAAGQGAMAALPGAQAAAKERRTEKKEALLARLEAEGIPRKEALELMKASTGMAQTAAQFESQGREREQADVHSQRMAGVNRYGYDKAYDRALDVAEVKAQLTPAQANKAMEDAKKEVDAAVEAIKQALMTPRNEESRMQRVEAGLEKLGRVRRVYQEAAALAGKDAEEGPKLDFVIPEFAAYIQKHGTLPSGKPVPGRQRAPDAGGGTVVQGGQQRSRDGYSSKEVK